MQSQLWSSARKPLLGIPDSSEFSRPRCTFKGLSISKLMFSRADDRGALAACNETG